MIKTHQIKVAKTAEISTIGDINTAENILIVLHGYGQLARYFIKKFTPLTKENIAIIAPEGLSKFYLEGNNGRVGASWMTKESREVEITDYLNYLDDLYAYFNLEKKNKILLGFSQGGATAVRHYMQRNNDYSALILCSTSVPLDITLPVNNTYFIYGNQDEYLSEEYKLAIHNFFKNIIIFKGKHEIDIKSIINCIKKGL